MISARSVWRARRSEKHELEKKGGRKTEKPEVLAVQTAWEDPFARFTSCAPAGIGERRLYTALRENIPIIDAAIDKILRLVGSFVIVCADENKSYQINQFLQNVKVNALECGVQSFLNAYLSQLLTYGNAVGRLCWPLQVRSARSTMRRSTMWNCASARPFASPSSGGRPANVPVRYPELVVASALNPPPGSAKGFRCCTGFRLSAAS